MQLGGLLARYDRAEPHVARRTAVAGAVGATEM
jgi:hypothetical protein